MATAEGYTQVLVSIETKDYIKKIADADGRMMKNVIERAIKEYAAKHKLDV